MKKIKFITIGADPEMFLVDTSNNEIICAKGIIPGKKNKPYTKGLPKGFGVEIDGILAEFNIPPCSDKTEYIDSIKFMKDWIRNYVKNKNPNLDILCKSSTVVPDRCIADPDVNQIGCDSDYNAYTREVNPQVDGYPDNTRCAGQLKA